MLDDVTGKRIMVTTDGTAGPYIIVPEIQAEYVRSSLTTEGIPFSENSNSTPSAGGTDSIFDLGQGAKIETIQRLLDDID